ncbi:exonuclease SbcCD subunit D [soil metagenome]
MAEVAGRVLAYLMLIAHLADLHLGFRAFHRSTAHGFNMREADVLDAFSRAIDQLVQIEPDLVLIAGDVFHSVRPSNAAIAEAFRMFSRLRARLPHAPVVMIAGDHDSPRSTETSNILVLFREIAGVSIAVDEVERFRFPNLDCSVHCLPHNAVARQHGSQAPVLTIEPDSQAARNVLMLHGALTGTAAMRSIPGRAESGGASISEQIIGVDRWDYVALGHHHLATEVHPNMWYAGAIERTSSDIWSEPSPKGFITYDTEVGLARFHPLETRATIDLPPIDATGLDAGDVDHRIRSSVDAIAGGLQGKMVRIVVSNLPRQVVRELNHRQIREYKAEALHFQLDARPPAPRRIALHQEAVRRQTLPEQVEVYLREHWTLSSEALTRDRLIALAKEYVERVGDSGSDA